MQPESESSNTIQSRIDAIERDAQAFDKDQAREFVLGRLTEMLVGPSQVLSDEDKDAVDAVLLDLVNFVDLSMRCTLSEVLADRPGMPSGIMRYLAHDEIDVAGPVLRNSPCLSEQDLMSVIDVCGREHRRSIVERPDISEAVSDAVLAKNEPDVVLAMLKNPGAHLSALATQRLVKMSERIEALRKPLLGRAELTTTMAHQMFWWVSAALRLEIMGKFKVDPEILDQLLVEATSKAVKQADEIAVVQLALQQVASGLTLSVEEFLADLKSGETADLEAAFARLAKISQPTAKRIIEDEGGQPLAVACKAMRLDRQQFTRLFLLVDNHAFGKTRPSALLATVSDVYDKIPENDALQLLRYWDAQNRLQAA